MVCHHLGLLEMKLPYSVKHKMSRLKLDMKRDKLKLFLQYFSAGDMQTDA